MGCLNHSLARLGFFGDELNPDEISQLLGANPTEAYRKGDAVAGRNSTIVRIAKTGRWSISATKREPEDLEGQIFELLNQLTQNMDVWSKLSTRYKTQLFCGIFMGSSNDGLPLSPKALFALGQRGITLDLDIYDASGELRPPSGNE